MDDSLTGWVQSIDIDTKVYRLLRTHTVLDLLDYTFRSNSVNDTSLYNLEATITIIVVVRETGKCSTDTSMDVGVVGQETFRVGVIEVCSVVNGRLFGWRSTEDLGAPGVAFER